MSLHLQIASVQLFVVLWPVYDPAWDKMMRPCFRLKVGSWFFPKRK